MRSCQKASSFTQIVYLLQRVVKDLFQRKITVLFTLLAIALSLSLPATGYLVWKNVQVIASDFSPKSEITVFLKPDISDKKGEELSKEITKLKGVVSVNYLSAQQTLAEFTAWGQENDNNNLLKNNALPAVIMITPSADFQTTSKLDLLSKKLKKIKEVDEVQFEKVFLQKITALSRLIVKVIASCAFLMIVSVLLAMTNGIRAEVFASKNKIEVMKLLGATDYFILRPFLYRTIIYCILSVLLAWMISQWFLFYFYPIVAEVSSIFDVNFQLQGFNLIETLSFLLCSILFGYISTYIAASYHLAQLEKKSHT